MEYPARITAQAATEYLKTGEKCPVSGTWENLEPLKTTVILQKGQIMPKYGGVKVYWTLIQKK